MKLFSKRKIKIVLAIFSLNVLVACGSGIDTHNNPQDPGSGIGNHTSVDSFAKAQVQKNIFSLGSDFPSDLVIPDLDGLRSTAFIVTGNASILAIDLDTLEISTQWKGPTLSAELNSILGFARKVKVLSSSQALFLGSNGLIYFNPSSGKIYESVDLTQTINPGTLALSKEVNGQNSHVGSFKPSTADSMAVIGNRLFVSMSNLSDDFTYFSQGIVLAFDLNGNAPFITPANPAFSLAQDKNKLALFNPTALSVDHGSLIVTVSGATEFGMEGELIPLSSSALLKINPQTLSLIDSVDLGLVSASFSPLAINPEGSRAFLGSSSFSQIYEIDLDNFSVLRGKSDPIVLSGLKVDYITGQNIAYGGEVLLVASYNQDAVRAIDLKDVDRRVLSDPLDFHLEPNPGLTGVGVMTLRPGEPGKDFSGADLFVLTSTPGTISSAITY